MNFFLFFFFKKVNRNLEVAELSSSSCSTLLRARVPWDGTLLHRHASEGVGVGVPARRPAGAETSVGAGRKRGLFLGAGFLPCREAQSVLLAPYRRDTGTGQPGRWGLFLGALN